jgi:hypothetical protein
MAESTGPQKVRRLLAATCKQQPGPANALKHGPLTPDAAHENVAPVAASVRPAPGSIGRLAVVCHTAELVPACTRVRGLSLVQIRANPGACCRCAQQRRASRAAAPTPAGCWAQGPWCQPSPSSGTCPRRAQGSRGPPSGRQTASTHAVPPSSAGGRRGAGSPAAAKSGRAKSGGSSGAARSACCAGVCRHCRLLPL